MANKAANQSGTVTGAAPKSLKSICGDLKSQLMQQEKSKPEYFESGIPKDTPSAIFAEGSRYFTVTTKTKAVAAGGDPAVWTRLKQTQKRYVDLAQHADFVDEIQAK